MMDVIDELIAHCEAWEPWARVMGNVCAGDAAQALRSLRAELAASKRAIEALVEFASTVAPGSSWWDDTWPEHEAAMAGGG